MIGQRGARIAFEPSRRAGGVREPTPRAARTGGENRPADHRKPAARFAREAVRDETRRRTAARRSSIENDEECRSIGAARHGGFHGPPHMLYNLRAQIPIN
ncbi:hypothetical protein [Burkholderia alba]|uniref:hypothetical protein n=1 Tax=Burkholderia alba TaxID=2683677 RepID=UPI002B05529F|nr:hypothetical protein [Burkholderia alba]